MSEKADSYGDIKEKNLDKLREKIGQFDMVSKDSGVLKNGKKVFFNSNGIQTSRLLSYQLESIFMKSIGSDKSFKHLYNGICFLNLNRFSRGTGKSGNHKEIVTQTDLILNLKDKDTKKEYSVHLPIGMLLVMLGCRDLLPGVKGTQNEAKEKHKRALCENLDKLNRTSFFKELMGDNNVIEKYIVANKKKKERRAVNKAKKKLEENKSKQDKTQLQLKNIEQTKKFNEGGLNV